MTLLGFLAVVSLTVVPNPPGDVLLAWDASDGASAYTLYWSTQPVNVATGRFDSPQSLDLASTSATVRLLTGNYFFAVTASGGGHESSYSNVVLAEVPAPSD